MRTSWPARNYSSHYFSRGSFISIFMLGCIPGVEAALKTCSASPPCFPLHFDRPLRLTVRLPSLALLASWLAHLSFALTLSPRPPVPPSTAKFCGARSFASSWRPPGRKPRVGERETHSTPTWRARTSATSSSSASSPRPPDAFPFLRPRPHSLKPELGRSSERRTQGEPLRPPPPPILVLPEAACGVGLAGARAEPRRHADHSQDAAAADLQDRHRPRGDGAVREGEARRGGDVWDRPPARGPPPGMNRWGKRPSAARPRARPGGWWESCGLYGKTLAAGGEVMAGRVSGAQALRGGRLRLLSAGARPRRMECVCGGVSSPPPPGFSRK